MKLAIVAGVAAYQHLLQLDACKSDAEAFRMLLEETKSYAEVCFLPSDVNGLTAKKTISEFVEKYKSQKVEELVFYFSGHGARIDDDFFYAFTDFNEHQKETGGLRNTELDGLIRNLAPELTFKIVDACKSGSTYIKADESELGPVLEKSAKDNALKKLYFFHSSAADQNSWAGPNFSHFTFALLESLAKQSGSVRYRDIMAAVADEMDRIKAPRPTFIVQAASTEVFIDIDARLSDLLKQRLGLIGSAGGATKKDLDGDEPLNLEDEQIAKVLPIRELAVLKANETFCSEEEAKANLSTLSTLLSESNWPMDITEAFLIAPREVATSQLPNRVAIGQFIESLKEDSLFASTTYESETYTTEEYREVPKKPTSSLWSTRGHAASLARLMGEDKEYKLEKVERQKRVLSGFQYTVDPIFEPHQIYFNPKLPSLERYAVTIIVLFSRRNLNFLYAVEHLGLRGWNDTLSPSARNWKNIPVPLKDREKIMQMTAAIISEVSDFVRTDTRSRLAA